MPRRSLNEAVKAWRDFALKTMGNSEAFHSIRMYIFARNSVVIVALTTLLLSLTALLRAALSAVGGIVRQVLLIGIVVERLQTRSALAQD